MKHRLPSVLRLALLGCAARCRPWPAAGLDRGQDRLKTMPGYQQYQKMTAGDSRRGEAGIAGRDLEPDGKSFEYSNDGKRYRYDVGDARRDRDRHRRGAGRRGRPAAAGAARAGAPERGRQFESARFARRQAEGVLSRSQPLGERRRRRRRGRGHDRRQREASGSSTAPRAGSTARSSASAPRCGGRPTAASSPTTASTRSRCPTTTSSSIRRRFRARSTSRRIRRPARRIRSSTCSSTTSRRRRPRGSTCATASRSTTPSSATTSTASRGRPTARELLFNRTNRRQNILEFAAANPETGATRVIVREEWPTGWVENSPR